MAGIKETTEVVVAANELAVDLIKRFKDGVQFNDFTEFYAALISNAEFKAKLEAGYMGVTQVPSEVSDLQIGEIIELGVLQLSYVPKIVEALKG